MPRRSRIERLPQTQEKVSKRRPTPANVTILFSALCPVCGRTISEFRALRVGYVTIGKVRYFDSIDWDPNKAFGVKYQAGGRGSFQEIEQIQPEHAPELFHAVKTRLLQALKEWVQKGWIDKKELDDI